MAEAPVALNAELNTPFGLMASALTVLNAAVTIGYPRLVGIKEIVIYVVFNSTAAAGSIVVEGAHDASYTGTWSNITTVAWAAASRVHLVAVTGCHLAIRVRVASAVTSGSIDVYAAAN